MVAAMLKSPSVRLFGVLLSHGNESVKHSCFADIPGAFASSIPFFHTHKTYTVVQQ
jgi:hypothetical protein